jgi:hypothetical protein
MPARDTRHIEIRHCPPFGSRANPFRQSGFDSTIRVSRKQTFNEQGD